MKNLRETRSEQAVKKGKADIPFHSKQYHRTNFPGHPPSVGLVVILSHGRLGTAFSSKFLSGHEPWRQTLTGALGDTLGGRKNESNFQDGSG
ncbi:MAG TPA: hypothetical protein V6C86_12960 [Oculatellaceae cyanobacterium]